MCKFYVGIDGGGTKTLVKVLYKDELIFERKYTSSNFQSIGKVNFEKLIRQILKELKDHGIAFENTSLCIGAAGVDRDIDKIYVRDVFIKNGFDGKIQVHNDGLIGLVGGNNSIGGGVLVAGTGSVALGYRDKTEYRVGGWGHLLGDEGSGYKISIEILGEILKSFDGRMNELNESRRLLNLINLSDSDAVLEYVYDKEKDKSHIAKLSKFFLKEYDRSTIVKRVLDSNLEENLLTIKALSKLMKDDAFSLTLCGGLFENCNIYYDLMKLKIEGFYPSMEVHKPKLPPVDGALVLAKNLEV